MSGRLNWAPEAKERLGKPGPASYNNDRIRFMGRTASWKIGNAMRNDAHFDRHARETASPAQYTISTKLTKQGSMHATFGNDKRTAPN
jgi:hypothetical protein